MSQIPSNNQNLFNFMQGPPVQQPQSREEQMKSIGIKMGSRKFTKFMTDVDNNNVGELISIELAQAPENLEQLKLSIKEFLGEPQILIVPNKGLYLNEEEAKSLASTMEQRRLPYIALEYEEGRDDWTPAIYTAQQLREHSDSVYI